MSRLPTDPPSHRAVENLIATYAELVDDGDFAGSVPCSPTPRSSPAACRSVAGTPSRGCSGTR